MILAEGDGDDKLAALFQVVDLNRAMVQFHKRARQVEADARTHISVVGTGFGLIEALKDLVELILRDLLAIVANGDSGMLVVVGKSDADLSARRGVLKGVGEHVDHHLVKVRTVNPYGQAVAVVLEQEVDLARLGLMAEEGIDVVDKPNEVLLTHVHLHLSLVDLTEVHHLVDEVQDALGIATNGLVDTLAVGVLLVLDK